MQIKLKIVLALLNVSLIHGVLAPVAHAQQSAPQPGYLIAEIDVTDPAKYKAYSEQVAATLAPFDGKFLVRGGGNAQSLEGNPPKRIVVIVFESAEKARAWYESAAYRAIKPIRLANATSRSFIVEGVPPP